MDKHLSLIIFCGFPQGNETGVHRFSNEIVNAIKTLVPSTYSVFWNKSDGEWMGYFRLLKDFLSIVGKVNVIHFTVMTPIEIPFILISKLLGKKILTTYHGDYSKQESITKQPHLKLLFWLGDKMFRNFSNVLVSPSNYLFQELRFSFHNCFIIPNPVGIKDQNGLIEKDLRKEPSDIIIITASNFNIREKVDALYYLFESFVGITSDLPQVKLYVFGDGTYLEEFKKKYDNIGNIEFMGFHSDIGNYLHNSDVYAHFSSFDNQPYAIIDALLNGKVILCNDLEALKEMVDPSTNYVIRLEKKNIVNSIKAIVYDIETNRGEFIAKGIKNKEASQSKYSSHIVSDQYLKLYNRLVDT